VKDCYNNAPRGKETKKFTCFFLFLTWICQWRWYNWVIRGPKNVCTSAASPSFSLTSVRKKQTKIIIFRISKHVHPTTQCTLLTDSIQTFKVQDRPLFYDNELIKLLSTTTISLLLTGHCYAVMVVVLISRIYNCGANFLLISQKRCKLILIFILSSKLKQSLLQHKPYSGGMAPLCLSLNIRLRGKFSYTFRPSSVRAVTQITNKCIVFRAELQITEWH